MFDTLKTMNDDDLRAMIEGIARCADPWSADVMAMSSDAIDELGDELLRRCFGRAVRQTRADAA